MYHVDNICSSLKPYLSDIEDSQDNTSSFSGQMNKSLPLHHAQNSHSVSQIKANINAKRDIAGNIRSLHFYHCLIYLWMIIHLYSWYDFIFHRDVFLKETFCKCYLSIPKKSYSYVYTNMHTSKDRISITNRICWTSIVVVVVVVVVAVVNGVMYPSSVTMGNFQLYLIQSIHL